jgi:hypothetical protein
MHGRYSHRYAFRQPPRGDAVGNVGNTMIKGEKIDNPRYA